MKASVIICTQNRADSLSRTIESLRAVETPLGLQLETLVVDNGSSDHTAEIVRRHSSRGTSPRYLFEPTPGHSVARNAGMAVCNGDVIVFIDDDVVPRRNWLGEMVSPLLRLQCEGVVGRIELAAEVCRPWMTYQHKVSLTVYEGPPAYPLQLIGANMAFHRSVLDRVPGFDPQLDAGALGFMGDTLFSWQMLNAGFRIRYAPEASVTHYPDPSRLLRSSWLAAGRRHGASMAYVLHHWCHEKVPCPRLRYYYVALKLGIRRLFDPPQPLDAEGAAPWEMSYVGEVEKYRKFLSERRLPRDYSKHGRRKLGSISARGPELDVTSPKFANGAALGVTG